MISQETGKIFFSVKQMVAGAFVLALVFHFVFYFNSYGPAIPFLNGYIIYLIAYPSVLIMFFLYLTTYWRINFKDKFSLHIYDGLVLWIIICIIRSLLIIRSPEELKAFLLDNYMALSAFPVLFVIAGINIKYFHRLNRILFSYMLLVATISIFFIDYFELQLFLLMPVFYIILTIPLRSGAGKIFVLLISVSIIWVSLTNRAGILRILIGYSIVTVYYLILYLKVNKKLLVALIFLILLLPPVALYMGIKGESIFELIMGNSGNEYSQLDPTVDTRTFLYYEVFQDLKSNEAFLFGKGINAGYYSASFVTYNRPIVEVGFLQIILKMGIVGFLLYVIVILRALFRALKRSKSAFMKSLGLLLASYLLMLFVENVIAYNLLNILIWLVVGICYSDEMLNQNDEEIKQLLKLPFARARKIFISPSD